jgi:hypothetical protein
VIEEKKLVHGNERSVPIVKKQAPPAVNHARKIHTSPTKTKPSNYIFLLVLPFHIVLVDLMFNPSFVFGIFLFIRSS